MLNYLTSTYLGADGLQITHKNLDQTLHTYRQSPLITGGQAPNSNQPAQLTLLVLLDSHNVLVVPALDPATSTATYFPFCADTILNEGLVAPDIFLQLVGTADLGVEIELLHAYHW